MTQPVWNTPQGELGAFPASVPMTFILSATAVLPASTVTYMLLSGALPSGLFLSSDGVISGTPDFHAVRTSSYFTIRVTDNLNNIRDRSFLMSVSGIILPKFLTPSGNLFPGHIMDGVWVDFQIEFDDPYPIRPTTVSLSSGSLPTGLEIDGNGKIRGYPKPPMISYVEGAVVVYATSTDAMLNAVVLPNSYSTNYFTVGRPVLFHGGLVFGGVQSNFTYYIKSIINSSSFTISQSQNGPTFLLTNGSGNMTVELPSVFVDTPTTKTYSFSLTLSGSSGISTSPFSITVKNQNLPISDGGLGSLEKVRLPVILNTRPLSYDISGEYQGYYHPTGTTHVDIGMIKSDEYFAFKVIGHDFETSQIRYNFGILPLGLTGDVNTGWVTGTPHISTGVTPYSFSVSVEKALNNLKVSDTYSFTFTISNEIVNTVTWLTGDDLGIISNGSPCTLFVRASAAVPLTYSMTGDLPPGLSFMPDGEITGYVAYQPSHTQVLPVGHISTYQFTVQVQSTVSYAYILEERTFTLRVLQEYRYPTDDIYIKATPGFSDRALINSLLTDTVLIPNEVLYRPTDMYFGKANAVKYGHIYGVMASRVNDYIASVNTHHYWRNVTLGELHTAVARNTNGEIVYEVVYSEVVDEMKMNEPTESPLFEDIEKNYVFWPVSVNGNKLFYPNSLANMRQQVTTTLGQSPDVRKLPLWMTSQQRNGSTLGYTAAWVICYTKPGYSELVKSNILLSLSSNITQTVGDTNVIRGLTTSFYTNMPVRFSGGMIGGLVSGTVYFIRDILTTNTFTISETINGPLFSLTNGLPDPTKPITMTKVVWAGNLNTINFTLDRFTVDKSLTFDYASNPPAWAELPSGQPTPEPLDSKDFHILFPRKTIRPDL